MHGTNMISSWEGGRPGLPVCPSWGQAVQYLDCRKVHKVLPAVHVSSGLGALSKHNVADTVPLSAFGTAPYTLSHFTKRPLPPQNCRCEKQVSRN